MIDESRLIDNLKKEWEELCDYSENVETLLEYVIRFIGSQPKIGGWIPTEEKLPPDGQKVLLSCNYMMFDYVTVGTIENGNRGKSYIADEDTFMRSAILAWQPLPNTYCK